jgi:capsular exopolysaccharide synthesis family protein
MVTTGSLQKVRLGEGVALVQAPGSARAEAIRKLRAQLVNRHFSIGRRALAICSPHSGGGSSFIAANLGLALAQAGLRTVILDADLRRPAMQTYFQTSIPSPGLGPFLRAREPQAPDEVLVEVLPNLTIGFGRDVEPDSADLISSPMFTELVHFCMRNFDATLIDLPPANLYADARTAASVAGYAILVARQGRTVFFDIDLLSKELRQDDVEILGSILVTD